MRKKELMEFLRNFKPDLKSIQEEIDNVLIDRDGIVSLNLQREDVRKKVADVAGTFKIIHTDKRESADK